MASITGNKEFDIITIGYGSFNQYIKFRSDITYYDANTRTVTIHWEVYGISDNNAFCVTSVDSMNFNFGGSARGYGAYTNGHRTAITTQNIMAGEGLLNWYIDNRTPTTSWAVGVTRGDLTFNYNSETVYINFAWNLNSSSGSPKGGNVTVTVSGLEVATKVYKTTDYGRNWQKVGVLKKTSDYGRSWKNFCVGYRVNSRNEWEKMN